MVLNLIHKLAHCYIIRLLGAWFPGTEWRVRQVQAGIQWDLAHTTISTETETRLICQVQLMPWQINIKTINHKERKEINVQAVFQSGCDSVLQQRTVSSQSSKPDTLTPVRLFWYCVRRLDIGISLFLYNPAMDQSQYWGSVVSLLSGTSLWPWTPQSRIRLSTRALGVRFLKAGALPLCLSAFRMHAEKP